MSKKNHNILFHFPQQIISNQIKTKQQKKNSFCFKKQANTNVRYVNTGALQLKITHVCTAVYRSR